MVDWIARLLENNASFGLPVELEVRWGTAGQYWWAYPDYSRFNIMDTKFFLYFKASLCLTFSILKYKSQWCGLTWYITFYKIVNNSRVCEILNSHLNGLSGCRCSLLPQVAINLMIFSTVRMSRPLCICLSMLSPRISDVVSRPMM